MIIDKIDFGNEVRYYDANGKLIFTISKDNMDAKDMDWDYSDIGDYYQSVVKGTQVFGKTLCEILNLKEKELNGENKEEKEMNKVLELYYERRINKLGEFYKELKEQKYNELEVVKEFNNVVEEYNNKMQELMGKYRDEENDMSLIHKTGYNEYPYVLSCDVKNEIYTSLTKRYDEDKKALLAEKETIAAVLSISDDKDYQVEVLKNYGILDKKGMMVEDDE